tara:strand:+ start:341 stop:595 length:255 start_codon:yes stop_codon:yes gene_type:complete
MESITIKVDNQLSKEIKRCMKPYYSTKTEFIREAIRDKLKTLETELFMKKLELFKGSAKAKITDKRLREIKEEVAKKYAKRLNQ